MWQRVSALVKAGRIKAVEIGGRPLSSQKELDRFASIPRKGELHRKSILVELNPTYAKMGMGASRNGATSRIKAANP